MSNRTFTVGPRPHAPEHRHTFPCFGGECTVIVADAARPADAAAAAAMGKRALLTWHRQFSRFIEESELSRLNGSAADEVAVSPLMRRMIEVALKGARDTGGLVDITLADEIEHAGYAGHLEGEGTALGAALAGAPPRASAGPHLDERWRRISIDHRRGTVLRPAGLRLDVGGIAKGVFADELAAMLEGFDAYAVDCAGDVRIGGRARLARPVHVASPFDASPLHTFSLTAGSVATSGIGRRSWIVDGGRPAHHLLDPRTGRPAFTGIVQATAIAPTATQAEILAKAALLSGPARAGEWLTHGGLVVRDDGHHQVLVPPSAGSGPPSSTTSTAGRPGSLRISWKPA
ncbi:MAG TPA: FAD:protein FMN transferase [Solirubrobacteraceae bacterium]|nr:FAD:protein FMN transferase [Solirubrobacteraceae bacterium]